jgi:hypothetical protein
LQTAFRAIETLLASVTGRQINGRRDVGLGQRAVENDLAVAGALKLFKDALIHPRASVNKLPSINPCRRVPKPDPISYEKDIDIPIVSIVYDGTTTNKNELLAPYLHYISRSVTGEINHITV